MWDGKREDAPVFVAQIERNNVLGHLSQQFWQRSVFGGTPTSYCDGISFWADSAASSVANWWQWNRSHVSKPFERCCGLNIWKCSSRAKKKLKTTHINCNDCNVEINRVSVVTGVQVIRSHEEQVTAGNAAGWSTVKIDLADWCLEVETVGGW